MSYPFPTDAMAPAGARPIGKHRGIGFGILMYIITLGIYSYYWIYKSHEEIKRSCGEGIGGVLGIVCWFVLSPINAFVLPSEVATLYTRAGKPAPMSGWTGLWLFPGGLLIIPAIVWYVKIQGALNRFWDDAAATAPAPSAFGTPQA